MTRSDGTYFVLGEYKDGSKDEWKERRKEGKKDGQFKPLIPYIHLQ